MTERTEQRLYYSETQRFDQWWIRFLIWIPPLAVLASLIFTLSHNTGIGNMGTFREDWVNWMFIIIITSCPTLLFTFFKLLIEVRAEGIWYRFYGLHLRWHSIPLQEIQSAIARVYHPIREYGGWGIRYGRNGKAYNVSGNEGVLVTLNKGETVLFGSQRMNDFESGIKLAISDAKRQF